jgi:hypothetical protein
MRISVFICLLALLASCVAKEAVPRDVIQPDKMKLVMWDMVRADEFLSAYVFAKDSTLDKKKASDSLYAVVFKLHHISPADFSKSFQFYRTHPNDMKALVDSINSSVANTTNLNFNPPAFIDTNVHKGSLKAQ